MSQPAQLSNVIADVAGVASRYLPEPLATGAEVFRDVARSIDSEVGGVSLSAEGDIASLIQVQIEAQREMQTSTMVSNVEKSKHESKMATIRNVRVG